MVDRYTPMYAETATDRYCHMLQSPTGSFVLASDFGALAARLAEAEALLHDVRDHGGTTWRNLTPRIDAFLAPDSATPVRFSLDEEYADPPVTHQPAQKINAKPEDAPDDAFVCNGCEKWANWSGKSKGWALCNCGKFRRPDAAADQPEAAVK